jgi:hypothetical protein
MRFLTGTVGYFIAPGRTSLDAAKIRKMRRELILAHRRLRRYVNTHSAHRQRQPARKLPTFQELHAAVDALARALEECTLLLEAASLLTVVPDLPHSWTRPFRVAWLRGAAESSERQTG